MNYDAVRFDTSAAENDFICNLILSSLLFNCKVRLISMTVFLMAGLMYMFF